MNSQSLSRNFEEGSRRKHVNPTPALFIKKLQRVCPAPNATICSWTE
ncbi:MAG: hypothetical protein FWF27_05120 [Candidatus Bathyarchaeota archaeon]|nr:hypothetical protein [Candidatus Termiticorpusculum sp.]